MKKFYSLAAVAAVALFTFAASAFNGVTAGKPSCSMKSITAPTNRIPPSFQSGNIRKSAPAKAPSGEWTAWTDAGTATFSIDNGLADFGLPIDYSGDFKDIKVSVRNDVQNADIIQYRLSGVYDKADIILDYNKSTGALNMPLQPTGFTYNGKALEVMDAATGFRTFMPGEDGEAIAAAYQEYNYFISPMGRFYIYLVYTYEGLYDFCAITDVQVQLDGYPDFTPELTFYNRVDETTEYGIIRTPEECDNVRYGVMEGGLSQAKINAVLNGDEGTFSLSGGGHYIKLPELKHNKAYTIIAVSFAGGIACEMSSKFITYMDDEAGKWRPLGETEVTTDFLESMFGAEPSTFKTAIEQNIENPDLYRLVDVHGIANPFIESADLDGFDGKEYLIFDAADPAYVLLQPAVLRVDFGGGAFLVDSYYTYLVEGGKKAETAKSTAEGGVIDPATGKVTFGDRSFIVRCDDWSALGGVAGNAYSAGRMQFTIPGYAGVSDIIADSDNDSAARYFNLQGVEVSSDSLAPGLYIRSNGRKASKVLVH